MTFHKKFAGAESVYAFLGGFPQIRTSADFAAGFRVQAEQEIERLIALLDVLDGDADPEPSFGHVPCGYEDEQETDADIEEGDGEADEEPSLGRHEFSDAWEPANLHLYGEIVWQGLHDDDREHDAGDMAEHDLDKTEGEDSEDREPEVCGEASLGWGNPSEWKSQAKLDCNDSGLETDLEDDAGSNPEEDAGDLGEECQEREPSLGWRCGLEVNQARHDISNGVTDGEVDAGEEMERCDHETGFSGPLTEIERAAVAMIRRKTRTIGRHPLRDPHLCTILRPGSESTGPRI